MEPRALIAAIRRGEALPECALARFAAGLASGAVSDAQAGAFAMAVMLKGLGEEGRVALTAGFRDSGHVLAWDLPGPVIDKHSTGGVGDPVSLILAPALAASGAYVPMISGRGLGHTGGTLDKLEAVPGVATQIDEWRLREITAQVGCAIVGATGEIAPADRRLYAIRDVTGTVESVDLITASILSKKLAAGLDALVLDVKCGSGAFMKSAEDARALARALTGAGTGAGCPTEALITDMSQPLAPAMGNALEVAVCMALLTEGRPAAPRLHDLTVALGGRALRLGGIADGEALVAGAIASGTALERFCAMLSALGGPPDMAEDWRTHLGAAPIVGDVTAPEGGYVTAIDGEALGHAVVALGGGRQVESDKVNPSVGLSEIAPLGTFVEKGAPLCLLHAADEEGAFAAAQAVRAAITLGEGPLPEAPLVLEEVTA
ncbi:thymidine phosphorylase [Pseudoroseicyclus tamaricis]|uniref:Thymidine phosphorylase n=1 Tax=Pseudoroseicyclus tamaricis TaxID=2705421 RepID=A0A6B2K2Y3_9RHOB|nr:thymidine phosphorylase [Pseudoroseicyclus tamaricis]NDV02152.1 thymidine phosphorylase [Pseudoroseicyclus tamaricis]